MARALGGGLTANSRAAAPPAPIATANRWNMASAVPRWLAVRRRAVRSPPTAAAAGRGRTRRIEIPRGGNAARRPSADHVRQQAQEAGALDRLREFALLGGANRGDPGGHDLAALGNVTRQKAGVLIVDLRCVRA